ncbi:MAG TPA: multicopper oxidase domain-containing protein, partial [Candidatus Limnocylindria bacterium]|nr:multicopper oxidase domain-containing protein [Candidatus Limnocylindria bacterium]
MPVTRLAPSRHVLASRVAIAVLVALLGAQVPAAVATPVPTVARPMPYAEPPVLKSRNGVLRVSFSPQTGTAIVNGRTVYGMTTFTGTYPGPTLKVKPGDRIEMNFVNLLKQDTNLHFHGFRVSPAGIADNVLRT